MAHEIPAIKDDITKRWWYDKNPNLIKMDPRYCGNTMENARKEQGEEAPKLKIRHTKAQDLEGCMETEMADWQSWV